MNSWINQKYARLLSGLKQRLRKYIYPHDEVMKILLDIIPNKPIIVLDVGCGSGWLLEYVLLNASENSIGFGAETNSIYHKNELLINNKMLVVSSHPPESMEFDIIILSDVLHHVSEKEIFLQSYISKLKPGGYIFVKDMNSENNICKLWNRVHDYVSSGERIQEISPSMLIDLIISLSNEANLHINNARLGYKRIFLYDHYWCVFKSEL